MQRHREARIEPAAAETFTVLPGRADAGLILLGDHAGNAFPPGYNTLGLEPAQLARHIAYDIGAAEITRQLALALGLPAVLTRYSRLLIDLNRGEDDPTLIMRLSDGAIVPGNRHLEAAERQRRIDIYYRPYHAAVDRVLDDCLSTGVSPAILSIHSFTESWRGRPRPWHAGVLWDKDPRLARPLLDALNAEPDLLVGDNQPYSGHLEGDTVWRHGFRRGLAHAVVEVRQDLIGEQSGQRAWAVRLERLIKGLAGRRDIALRFQLSSVAAGLGDGNGPVRPYVDWDSLKPTEGTSMSIDDKTRTELEAAAFRRLVEHLRTRTDVQNIDLMNLSGFCRNCLANWYQEAAAGHGHPMTKDEARETIYGMPYKEWQERHQKEATPAQAATFEKVKPHSH